MRMKNFNTIPLIFLIIDIFQIDLNLRNKKDLVVNSVTSTFPVGFRLDIEL